MKKNLFSVMMMAFVATMSFVSCDKTEGMTDDDFAAAMTGKSYTATVSSINYTLVLKSTGSQYVVRPDSTSFGTWRILEGELALSETGYMGEDEEVETNSTAKFFGTLAKEGKEVTFPGPGSTDGKNPIGDTQTVTFVQVK